MVAITVILAAVIGTFVLGLGDQVQNTTPQASFGFDTADSKTNVTITHETGDTIEASDLSIVSTVAFNNSAESPTEFTTGTSHSWAETTGDSEVSAGTSAKIGYEGTGSNFGGETVRVVFDSPDSDSTSTLAKFEVPK